MNKFSAENSIISINDKKGDKAISLEVEADGEVYLNIGRTHISTSKQKVVEFQEGIFLKVYTFNQEDNALLIPLTPEKKVEVLDFFKVWSINAIEDLKKSQWEEFLRCWRVVLSSINENIDLKKHKVHYKIQPSDLTDCGGGLSIWMDIYVTRGVSWVDDFKWSIYLNDKMFDDMFCEGVFDSGVFLGVMINFKPKYGNSEDFLPISI